MPRLVELLQRKGECVPRLRFLKVGAWCPMDVEGEEQNESPALLRLRRECEAASVELTLFVYRSLWVDDSLRVCDEPHPARAGGERKNDP